MMRSLIWKEWSEQRWKAALGAVIVVGLTAVGLRTRLLRDADILRLGGGVAALLLPVLVGMGVIAGERAAGTLATLTAMPIRAGWVLLAKLLVAAAVCVVPVAAAAGVGCALAGGRELSVAGIVHLQALAAAAAVMMLLWTVALGVAQPTEARAALLGVAFLAVGLAPMLLPDSGSPFESAATRAASSALLNAHPAGWLFAPRRADGLPPGGLLATQLLDAAVLVPLTAALLRRRGRGRG